MYPVLAFVINYALELIRSVPLVPSGLDKLLIGSCRMPEAFSGLLIQVVDYFPVWDGVVGLLLDNIFYFFILLFFSSYILYSC